MLPERERLQDPGSLIGKESCCSSQFLLCVQLPGLPAGPVQASPSGREPGLDLQGQLIQGVLVDDEALVQQVLSHLGWGNTEDRLHLQNSPSLLSLAAHLRSPHVVFLRNPNNKDAPAAC